MGSTSTKADWGLVSNGPAQSICAAGCVLMHQIAAVEAAYMAYAAIGYRALVSDTPIH